MSLIGGRSPPEPLETTKYWSLGAMSAGVDPGDAADELQVVVPQAGAPRQQLVGLGVDQADAVAVLAGDLAPGVDDEQLGAVVREHQRLHGEGAVDADAAGDVVVEAGDDRARWWR